MIGEHMNNLAATFAQIVAAQRTEPPVINFNPTINVPPSPFANGMAVKRDPNGKLAGVLPAGG